MKSGKGRVEAVQAAPDKPVARKRPVAQGAHGVPPKRAAKLLQLKVAYLETELKKALERIKHLESSREIFGATPAETAGQAWVGMKEEPLRYKGSADDMLADAVARGRRAFRFLSDDPHMLDAAAMAERLGITVQGLHKKRKSGEVLGLNQVTRQFWFPDWQILPDGRLVAGLRDLHERLGGDAWAVFRFLDQQIHPALGGRSGRDALIAGEIKNILTVVDSVCEGGYS